MLCTPLEAAVPALWQNLSRHSMSAIHSLASASLSTASFNHVRNSSNAKDGVLEHTEEPVPPSYRKAAPELAAWALASSTLPTCALCAAPHERGRGLLTQSKPMLSNRRSFSKAPQLGIASGALSSAAKQPHAWPEDDELDIALGALKAKLQRKIAPQQPVSPNDTADQVDILAPIRRSRSTAGSPASARRVIPQRRMRLDIDASEPQITSALLHAQTLQELDKLLDSGAERGLNLIHLSVAAKQIVHLGQVANPAVARRLLDKHALRYIEQLLQQQQQQQPGAPGGKQEAAEADGPVASLAANGAEPASYQSVLDGFHTDGHQCRELADILWAYGKLRHTPPRQVYTLLLRPWLLEPRTLAAHAAPIELAKAAVALAQLLKRDSAVWKSLEEASIILVPRFHARALSSLLWAFAEVRSYHSKQLLLAAAEQIGIGHRRFNSQDLALTAHALVRLGIESADPRVSRQVFYTLGGEVQRKIRSFTAGELVKVVTAYGELQEAVPQMASTLASALRRQLPAASVSELAESAVGFQAMQHADVQLYRMLSVSLVDGGLGHLSVPQLVRCMAAFALGGLRDKAFYEQAMLQLQQERQSLTPAQAVTALKALDHADAVRLPAYAAFAGSMINHLLSCGQAQVVEPTGSSTSSSALSSNSNSSSSRSKEAGNKSSSSMQAGGSGVFGSKLPSGMLRQSPLPEPTIKEWCQVLRAAVKAGFKDPCLTAQALGAMAFQLQIDKTRPFNAVSVSASSFMLKQATDCIETMARLRHADVDLLGVSLGLVLQHAALLQALMQTLPDGSAPDGEAQVQQPIVQAPMTPAAACNLQSGLALLSPVLGAALQYSKQGTRQHMLQFLVPLFDLCMGSDAGPQPRRLLAAVRAMLALGHYDAAWYVRAFAVLEEAADALSHVEQVALLQAAYLAQHMQGGSHLQQPQLLLPSTLQHIFGLLSSDPPLAWKALSWHSSDMAVAGPAATATAASATAKEPAELSLSLPAGARSSGEITKVLQQGQKGAAADMLSAEVCAEQVVAALQRLGVACEMAVSSRRRTGNGSGDGNNGGLGISDHAGYGDGAHGSGAHSLPLGPHALFATHLMVLPSTAQSAADTDGEGPGKVSSQQGQALGQVISTSKASTAVLPRGLILIDPVHILVLPADSIIHTSAAGTPNGSQPSGYIHTCLSAMHVAGMHVAVVECAEWRRMAKANVRAKYLLELLKNATNVK